MQLCRPMNVTVRSGGQDQNQSLPSSALAPEDILFTEKKPVKFENLSHLCDAPLNQCYIG